MAATYPQGYQRNRKAERLSQKLKGFSVKTLKGIVLGHVIDVLANQRGEPEILVALPEPLKSSQKFFFLKTNTVKQVNLVDRLLLVPETSEITQIIANFYSSVTPSKNSELGEDPDETLPLNYHQTPAKVVDEANIALKAEKLVIERERKKVGEVVVRKEVETHYIQVPVKREKLIIEQVSDQESKRLAEIPLSEQIINS